MIVAAEDFLLGEIRKLFGNRLKTVDSLPGDWDIDLLNKFLLAAPAAYLAFTGGPKLREADVTVGIDGRWSMLAVTAHASGNAARRRGDSRQIGAYEIIDYLLPHFHNLTVPEIGTMKLVNVQNLYNGTIETKGVAVYAALFSLPMYFDAGADPADLADFVTFQADYDLAPKDGRTEASDTVKLEQ